MWTSSPGTSETQFVGQLGQEEGRLCLGFLQHIKAVYVSHVGDLAQHLHELILTPEGDKVKLFELVYFQKHAPKEVLEHWNILVGRQPVQNIGLRTNDGWEISGDDVQIWLEEQGENSFAISAYCEKLLPMLREEEGRAWWMLTTLTDQVLGEIPHMRYSGFPAFGPRVLRRGCDLCPHPSSGAILLPSRQRFPTSPLSFPGSTPRRAYNNLADSSEPEGRKLLHQALELMQSHEEELGDTYSWNFRMGYAYYYLDQEGRALRHFEKALELHPGDDPKLNTRQDMEELIDSCKKGISLPQFWECFRGWPPAHQ